MTEERRKIILKVLKLREIRVDRGAKEPEAETAQRLADVIVKKHSISQEELDACKEPERIGGSPFGHPFGGPFGRPFGPSRDEEWGFDPFSTFDFFGRRRRRDPNERQRPPDFDEFNDFMEWMMADLEEQMAEAFARVYGANWGNKESNEDEE